MKLKNILAKGLGLGVAIASPQIADAQENLSGNFEAILNPVESAHSSMRANALYSLPGDIGAYQFIDLFSDRENKPYFGKAILSRSLTERVDAKGELVYGTGFDTKAGIGLGYNFSMPEGTNLSIRALPLWFNRKGIIEGDASVVLGFGVGLFGGKVNLGGFGGACFNLEEGTADWGYGELDASVQPIPGLDVGVRAQLQSQGKFKPKVEPAVFVRFSPRSRHRQ